MCVLFGKISTAPCVFTRMYARYHSLAIGYGIVWWWENVQQQQYHQNDEHTARHE